jgi:hypothetical protein
MKIPRFQVVARDVPPAVAAARLGLSEERFSAVLQNLIQRGFPSPDPDTGNFDLHAIDRWCNARHVHLFGADAAMRAKDAGTVAKGRIEAMRNGGSAS